MSSYMGIGPISYNGTLQDLVGPVPSNGYLGAMTSPTQLVTPQVQVPASQSPTVDDLYNYTINSPQYKQAMENVQLWANTQKEQAAFNQDWNNKFYELQRQQVANSMPVTFSPSYGAGEQYQKQLDELQKQIAAHDYANQQEYIKESLGSRGLGSSGQGPLEQAEAKFDFDNLNKQIDIQAQAREAELAQARANAAGAAAASRANQQADISRQLATMDLQHQYDAAKYTLDSKQLEAEIAQRNGQALLQVSDQLTPMLFNSQTGAYQGPGGQVITVQQAQQSVQPSYSAPAPAPSPYLYSMTSTPAPAPAPAPISYAGTGNTRAM